MHMNKKHKSCEHVNNTDGVSNYSYAIVIDDSVEEIDNLVTKERKYVKILINQKEAEI